MSSQKVPEHLIDEAVKLYSEHGSQRKAMVHASRVGGGKGISRSAFVNRLKLAEKIEEKISKKNLSVLIHKQISKHGQTIDFLMEKFQVTREEIYESLNLLAETGYQLHEIKDIISIEKQGIIQTIHDDIPTYMSRPDNTYVFGAISDTHIASKYTRYDVMEDLYDNFVEAEVDRVFHSGNWIDGEFRFNKHDLEVLGIDAQCQMLADRYPKRKGLTTYAVSGDDHEGWFAQREGLDIGYYAESLMRRSGREDWINLGYMEAFIRLVNVNTGQSSVLLNVHPGGGSSYALSYSTQKIIESYDGGEKPAVGLFGHYHKLWAGNIRNVWCIQVGCCQDQTPFMRKKKLEAHVGGAIIKLTQDPATGAIVRCAPELFRYFNKGYYNKRWGYGGPITLPERSV